MANPLITDRAPGVAISSAIHAGAVGTRAWPAGIDSPMSHALWRIYSVLTTGILALAVILGGSSQRAMFSTAVLELASLPLLGLGLWWQARRAFRGAIWPVAILVMGVAAMAIELVPLPLALWRALPGRAAVLSDMIAAGAAPTALPASLSPDATARSLMSLLPGAAIFFGVLAMNCDERRRLTQFLLALGIVSTAIGLAQATGQTSGFYSITNAGSAVGFFANRNHFAAMSYALIPFAAAVAVAPVNGRTADRTRRTIIYAGVAASLALGIVASGSRTGLALGLAAILSCGALWSRRLPEGRRRVWIPVLVVGASLALVGALQFTRVGALTQEKLGSADEGRAVVTATTLRVAQAYAPIGSGLGSFPALYEAAEPAATLSPEYVNHAHNDWAELWLEGGAPIAGIIVAFLVWYGAMTARAWRAGGLTTGRDQALRRAASIGLAMLLIHSAVDYPLRTGTLMAVFGFACALLTTPPRGSAASRYRKLPVIDTSSAATGR